jgi:hypothetical protein
MKVADPALLGAMMSAARSPASAGSSSFAGVEFKLRQGFLSQLRLHRLPRQLAGPAPTVQGRCSRRSRSLRLIAGRRRQPPARLRPPGGLVNVLMALSSSPSSGGRERKKGQRMSLLPVEVMSGAVRGGTSILYAALGETIGERAGVINLGTEGSMLVGALGAYAVAVETGNPWWGVVAGAVAGGCCPVCTPTSSAPRREPARIGPESCSSSPSG